MLAPIVIDATCAPVEPVPAMKRDDYPRFTKSRSSSISQGSQSSLNYRKFNHHREPTVMDHPYAVEAIRDALIQNDSNTLAALVQQYGLPPSLRSAAWPLLLRTHPYVQEAQARAAAATVSAGAPREPAKDLPLKRIKGDIRRMRRYRGPMLMEDAIFDAIHGFLLQWGDVIPYDGAMVWIADFLASGDCTSANETPVSGTPSSGTPLSRTPSGGTPSDETPASGTRASVAEAEATLTDSRQLSSGDNSGTRSANSSANASMSSTPVAGSPELLSSPSGFYTSHFNNGEDSASSNETAFSFSGISAELLPEVFTNIMLLINHSPAEFSHFIAMLRQSLPELSEHFAHEGILAGAAGGDDWLIWWLKWMGIRAFSPTMVARLWDEYFSLRADTGVPLVRQHLFLCILLMKENRMRLLELDQSECRQFLGHMPPSRDMEALIKDSRTLALAATSGS